MCLFTAILDIILGFVLFTYIGVQCYSGAAKQAQSAKIERKNLYLELDTESESQLEIFADSTNEITKKYIA